MVPVFPTLMLAKRTVQTEREVEERDLRKRASECTNSNVAVEDNSEVEVDHPQLDTFELVANVHSANNASMLFYDQTPHQIEDKVYLVKLTMKLMLLGNAVKFKQLCLQNVTSILCLINKVFFRVFGECYIFSKRRNLIHKVVVIEKRPKKTKGYKGWKHCKTVCIKVFNFTIFILTSVQCRLWPQAEEAWTSSRHDNKYFRGHIFIKSDFSLVILGEIINTGGDEFNYP
ncbi:hypothetical protein YC2023_092594 [Brassica napus]